MASAKGALTSTEPSISATPSSSPRRACSGMIRSRKASRPGHASPRSRSERVDLGQLAAAGKAPGKLAVARAAKTSSSGSAPALPPSTRGSTRGSRSTGDARSPRPAAGCAGAASRMWPLKSVAVTNRSSGCPGGSSGAAAGALPPSPRARRRSAARSRARRTAARTSASGSAATAWRAPRRGFRARRWRRRRCRAAAACTTPAACAQNLADARPRPRVGIEQHVDVGALEPQPGQRLERLAGMDRLGEEHAVDPAGAGPGDDVGQHPQAQAVLRLDAAAAAADRRARVLPVGGVAGSGRRGSPGRASTAPWSPRACRPRG